MSRHRNVRLFHEDASSVDDDKILSPSITAAYVRSSEKSKLFELSAFVDSEDEKLNISVDDFPDNQQVFSGIPDVSGRIVHNQTKENEFLNKEVVQESIFLSEEFENEIKLTKTSDNNNLKLDELDFGLLESITESENKSRETFTSSNIISAVTNLSKTRASNLSFKYSSLGACKLSENFLNSCKVESSDAFKKTSVLGSLFVKKSSVTRDVIFEHFVIRFLHTFIRSRSALLNYFYPICKIEVPVFCFDEPEPTVFKRTLRSNCIKKYTLPPPKSKTKNDDKITTVQNQKNSLTDQPEPSVLFSEKLNASQAFTPKNSVISTPHKPINRSFLLQEYEKSQLNNDKEIVNLIVLGHVDAGKSTLMGNLLFQLGYVSNKLLAKYNWESQKIGKASFAYAWVLDQTSEERNRGVTMDIAQTSFETKTKRVALMDAPGHKDFVPRVIGGLSQADVALLVINSTKGEFETGVGVGGQTREHVLLARLLGVSRVIVAVNKMDTIDWDKERYNTVQEKLNSLFKSMNFSSVIYCPVSGLYGTNLVGKSDEPSHQKLYDWYHGPYLIDLIDSVPSPERIMNGPFRFVVSDIFKPAGSSIPFVAGRVVCGAVSAGINMATSKVVCQPSDVRSCVKSIRSLCKSNLGAIDNDNDMGGRLLDQVVKFAFAGDQVALMLSDIDPFLVLAPGDLLSDPDNPIPCASRIRAKLLIFNLKQPITKGYPVIVYYSCTNVSANVNKLLSMTYRENKTEKTVKKPRCILGNCTADVELMLDSPICLEVYENCKPLGRFMLRVGGESIAGGTVTSILPSKKNLLCDL